MAIAPLHVQVKSDADQTTFDIHHFNPAVRTGAPSKVGPRYEYVVLAHGPHDGPMQVRIFIDYTEVLALYEQLTPIVEQWRAAAQPVVVAAMSPAAPEVALL
jgi:hypothetical protein